ncbi:MAG: acetate kinase [Oscillospiraceae bacterium]|jgi:acetate kinase|nr:acetate kinase [Oscillospiraceae bacterium]
MLILVINAGSSSLKYQLINMETEAVLAKGGCERVRLNGSKISGKTGDGREFAFETPMQDHTQAFLAVKDALTSGSAKVIDNLSQIKAIGHRVVQGGARFQKPTRVTPEVLEELLPYNDLAPLHNPPALEGIRACLGVVGTDLPQVLVFDTAFHSTMPPESYIFPLPYEYYEKYGIRRYGFHGTSHQFVSLRAAEVMGEPLEKLKLITCHLGNGSSIAAVKYGKVLDTSMGLTPLDGFLMGTRCGAVDPSAVLFLMEKEGWTPEETSNVLNKRSGALGVSGVSSDDRDLKAAAEAGNERAVLARSIQRYQIRKLIGAYAAAMDGADAIVFTGGIGENTTDLRADICANLTYLGIAIDENENSRLIRGKEGELSTPDSKVKVYVLPTNEELLIARQTLDLIR